MALGPNPKIEEKLAALGFTLVGGLSPSWERWKDDNLVSVRVWRSDTIARVLWYIRDQGVRSCEFECVTPQELWAHIEFTLNLQPYDIG